MDGVNGRGRAPRRAGARRGLGRTTAAWRNGIRDGFKNRSPAGSNPAAAIFGISSDFVQCGLTGADISLTFTCRQSGDGPTGADPETTGVSQMNSTTETAETLRAAIETASRSMRQCEIEMERADNAISANDTTETREAFETAVRDFHRAYDAYVAAKHAFAAHGKSVAGGAL